MKPQVHCDSISFANLKIMSYYSFTNIKFIFHRVSQPLKQNSSKMAHESKAELQVQILPILSLPLTQILNSKQINLGNLLNFSQLSIRHLIKGNYYHQTLTSDYVIQFNLVKFTLLFCHFHTTTIYVYVYTCVCGIFPYQILTYSTGSLMS